MKRIAITGAAGGVGTGLRRELLMRGYALQLLDIRAITNLAPAEKSVVVDIAQSAELAAALAGCDAVVHLAACTSDADWPEQIALSVQGSINLFEAARSAGVPRVIYASSNHVVGLCPRAPGTRTETILRPDSRYGVAKAFGELVGSLHAYKFGLRVLTVRIGNANDRPIDRRRLGNWISWRDLAQLVAIGVEHPSLVHEVVWGISDATGRQYDNSPAYALGYRPQDSAEPWEAEVMARDPAPAPGSDAARQPQEAALGGDFAQSEYVGSTDRLLPRGT